MQNRGQAHPAPSSEPGQRTMFKVLPFREAGLTGALPAKIGQTEGKPGPERCFITYDCSPGIEAGPGYVGPESADPVLLGSGVNLPKMRGERHQDLLAQVLGIEIALIDRSGVSGECSRAQSLVDHLLNDRRRLRPQKGVQLSHG